MTAKIPVSTASARPTARAGRRTAAQDGVLVGTIRKTTAIAAENTAIVPSAEPTKVRAIVAAWLTIGRSDRAWSRSETR